MYSHNEIKEQNNPDCKECFGAGNILVYFVDHRKKRVIEEWVYCTTCYPTSSCFGFDKSCNFAEEISKEDADNLVKEKGYDLHVP